MTTPMTTDEAGTLIAPLQAVREIPDDRDALAGDELREAWGRIRTATQRGPALLQRLERSATTPELAEMHAEADRLLLVARNLEAVYRPAVRKLELADQRAHDLASALEALEGFEAPARAIVEANNQLARSEAAIRGAASVLERAYRNADVAGELPPLSAAAIAAIKRVREVSPQAFRGIDVDFLIRANQPAPEADSTETPKVRDSKAERIGRTVRRAIGRA